VEACGVTEDELFEKKLEHTERKTTTCVRRVVDNKGRSVVYIEDEYDGVPRKAIAVDDHIARFIREAITFVLERQ
jgi:hypothetical protein